jgi:Uma2 family endonuclease
VRRRLAPADFNQRLIVKLQSVEDLLFHSPSFLPYLLGVPSMIDTPATKRWLQICTDPAFANRPERFEIDSIGQLIMSPPPGFGHRQRARAIANLLDQLFAPGGHAGELATVEQAILTRDGQIRIADVVLLTNAQKRWLLANPTSPLPAAPPVCVEILSRSNTPAEIDEKRALYFDAGATEVWICNLDGSMCFFSGVDRQLSASVLCPHFPHTIPSEAP